jgi:hypothetical protein
MADQNATIQMFGDDAPSDEEIAAYAHLKAVCDALEDGREEYNDYVDHGSIPAAATAKDRDRLPHDSEDHHRRYKVLTRVLEQYDWNEVDSEIVTRESGNALRLECGRAAAEMRKDTTVLLVDGDMIREWDDVGKLYGHSCPVLSDIRDVSIDWIQ